MARNILKWHFKILQPLENYFVKVAMDTSKVKEVKIDGAVFVLGSTVINKTTDDVKGVLLKPIQMQRI